MAGSPKELAQPTNHILKTGRDIDMVMFPEAKSEAYLALFCEHAWHHFIEEADQLEHGILRQMLQRKLPLREADEDSEKMDTHLKSRAKYHHYVESGMAYQRSLCTYNQKERATAEKPKEMGTDIV